MWYHRSWPIDCHLRPRGFAIEDVLFESPCLRMGEEICGVEDIETGFAGQNLLISVEARLLGIGEKVESVTAIREGFSTLR